MSKLGYALQKRAVRALLKLPLPLVRKLGGPPVVIDGQVLEPRLQMLLKLFGDPPSHLASVAETRAGFDEQGAWLSFAAERSVATEELALGGVRMRRYRPQGLFKPAPALVFYHGGGHVAGSLASHDSVCRQLAQDVGCAVYAVDYRLAPEAPFPAGVEDGLRAFRALAEAAESQGVDPARIAVGGDSAGGNLAAVVAQQARRDARPPCFQMLWVPWVDMTRETRSYELFAESLFLERAKMRWYTNLYLPEGQDRADPRASPLYGDLRGLCPAAVLVAGFDPLRDEGIAYAEALKAAGVPVTLRKYGSLPHPFINIAGAIPDARAAWDEAVALLKAAFRPTSAR